MKYRGPLGIFAQLFLLATMLQAGREYPAQPGEEVRPQQYLLRMKHGVPPMSVIPTFIQGASVTAMEIPDVYLVKVPTGTLSSAISNLAAHLLVDYIEPNRVFHATIQTPNDPDLSSQWALQAVQAQQAWSLFPNQYLTAATAGTNRVSVAVIDTGVDCTHPDFINSGGNSTDSASGGQLNWSLSAVADDITTAVSPAACPWQDDYGHGTHVAGIVAAATQNATGVASLGYPLQVIAYKVLDNTGSGSDLDVSNAIVAAAKAGAQIISLSLTGAGYSQTMQAAVNTAWQHNSLVVAAAGNSSSSAIYYPADATFAVGVAATDSTGAFASFSNFGNGVGIAAPGVSILSTLPTYTVPLNGPNYGYLSGTSMSTPHVSALAGLLAMATPNTSNAAILQRIQQSASSSIANGGWSQDFGYGIINAYNALSGTLRSATLGSLVGQITDNNQNTITGAQIVVNSQTVTVDSSGLYRFPNLPAGSYTVAVTASGYTAVNLTATVAPGADTILPVIMGVTYGLFAGTVTDHGVAVPGAIVQAVSGGLIAATAVAGSTGQYSLWVSGGGTYALVTSGISRTTTTLAAQTVAPGGTAAVNLTAPTLGTISGVVTDTSSNPLAGVQITITGGNVSLTTSSAANGSYTTAPLPAGTYTLTFSSVGFQNFVDSNVALAADSVTTLNVEMSAVASPWYSSGGTWTNRTPVTILHAQVSGSSNLANFPVLVSVTDANLKTASNGGFVALSNGSDIVFTATDGLTKLNHEIETYNPATGQLTAWVQVPSVSPTADTLIYAYYGNAGAANQQNAAGVWDSNYKIVNHLNQPSGAVLDSTSNGNNASASSSGATYTAAGEIGGAYSFDGVNGLLTTPYSSTWSGSFSNYTVQMWLKFGAAVQNYEAALSVGGWGGPLSIWTYPSNGTNSFTLDTSGGGCATSSTTPVTTDTVNFHQIVMSYNGGTGKLTMYVDGVSVGQTSCTGTTSIGTAALALGGFSNFKLLPSTIDELRVSTTARSSDWILTEYRNQSSPGTFVTLGTQQNGVGGSGPAQVAAPTFNPTGGTFTSSQPVSISTTAGATIRYTTDGVTVPTDSVGTVYGGSITISSTTTLMAIAYKTGMTDSPVSTAVYTINLPTQVAAPTFNPIGGTYTSAQPVSISTTTTGATIRYTTDGVTVPTDSVGTVYGGSITISSTTTLMAIAYKTGMTDSAVSTAVYTINASGPAWYSTGGTWTSRTPVTLSHTQVSGSSNLANFPVLVSVTNANLKTVTNGGSVGESNGNDILFTASDGLTKLNHEIETYNPATGQLIAWVQVPLLSASADTSLYVYYGNATAGNQQAATAVWDSNYLGVWHMPSGASLMENDSTSNGNTATATQATAVSGEIGGGANYSGSQHDTLPGPALTAFPYAWTLSAWVKFTGVSGDGYGAMIAQSGSEGLFITQRSGSYHLNFYGVGGDHLSTATLNASSWYYVTAANNGGTLSLYINGVLDSTFTGVTDPFTVAYFGGDPGENLTGAMDEIRGSRTARPAAWIATEYNNQSSPSNFLTLGTQQNSGGGSPPTQVAAPTFNPIGGTYTSAQPVSISTTAGATIRYTTDGVTAPTDSVGTVYGGSITISSTTTLMAIAYKTGMTDSAVSTAVYTINASGPAWYSTGGTWTSRTPVTLSHAQVSGSSNLANFPVLVSVTNANLKTVTNGGSVGESNGNDILFTASDGLTKLNHEIETYNPATGQLIAWVQVPLLSASADTSLYVYYGNATAGNQQAATAVWDSNYLGVWHMPSGASLMENDSTSNGNTATATQATAVSGEIGGGANYSGSQHDTLPGPALTAFPYAWTLSAWVKFTGVSGDGYGAMIAQSGSEGLFITQRSGSYHLNFYGVGGDHLSTATLNASSWYYVTAANNGGTLSLYINGVLDSTFTGVTDPFTVAYFGGDPGENLTGAMDEIRGSRTARPAAWIATEYNNQSSPSNFLTLGTQQNSGGGSPPTQVAAPTFNPIGGTYTSAQPVSISTTAGATIRYTTDGVTAPTDSVGTVYGGSITISSTTTLMAIAYKTGMTDSAVSTAVYTINASGPAWYSTGGTWTSRTPVTLSHAQVSGSSNLANFPVLVSVTNANLKTVTNGGSVGESNGNDILFTASDGLTKLNHEIETYNPATGQLIAWVQVPLLSASADTSLYVYYGNATAGNQQAATAVWDSNYLGVWHMPSGASLMENDSTSNGNTATATQATAVSGEIGGGANYSGSQHDTLPGPALTAFPYAWTLSAWVKFTGVSGDGYGAMIAQSGSEGLFITQRSGSYHLNFYGVGGDHLSTATLNASSWYYVTAANNGGTLSLYINGVLDSTFTGVTDPFTVAYFGGDPGENLTGAMDEIRGSRTARPAAWIATEYNNQSSPSNFLTLGTQQQN